MKFFSIILFLSLIFGSTHSIIAGNLFSSGRPPRGLVEELARQRKEMLERRLERQMKEDEEAAAGVKQQPLVFVIKTVVTHQQSQR